MDHETEPTEKLSTMDEKYINAALPEIENTMERIFGFRPGISHHYSITQAVRAVANEYSVDVPNAIQYLCSRDREKEISRIVAQYITIGETYFFRHSEQFDFLEKTFLPALLKAKNMRNQNSVRIWSAGCSTGEEAYSFAILLNKSISDFGSERSWNLKIFATDANPEALDIAKTGAYGKWSFRGVGSEIIETWFTPILESALPLHDFPNDKRMLVKDDIRKIVSFRPFNVNKNNWDDSEIFLQPFDVIVCRNVLMYFTTERIRTILDKFHSVLSDDGILVVGPSESWLLKDTKFVVYSREQAQIFSKADVGSQNTRRQRERADSEQEILRHKISIVPPARPSVLQSPAAHRATMISIPAETRSELEPSTARDDSRSAFISSARIFADKGDFSKALEFVDRALTLDKIAPELHYMRAMILLSMGNKTEAKQSLQKAIFLWPEFVPAYISLAGIAKDTGSIQDMRRHYSSALALLGKMRDEDIVPGSDGIPAGVIKSMILSLSRQEVVER